MCEKRSGFELSSIADLSHNHVWQNSIFEKFLGGAPGKNDSRGCNSNSPAGVNCFSHSDSAPHSVANATGWSIAVALRSSSGSLASCGGGLAVTKWFLSMAVMYSITATFPRAPLYVFFPFLFIILACCWRAVVVNVKCFSRSVPAVSLSAGIWI